jgi:hypothetical protein
VEGYASPEEAALGGIPERYARVVSVDVAASGERAILILEVIRVHKRDAKSVCEREDDRWYFADSLGTDYA